MLLSDSRHRTSVVIRCLVLALIVPLVACGSSRDSPAAHASEGESSRTPSTQTSALQPALQIERIQQEKGEREALENAKPSLRIAGRVLDENGSPIDGATWRFLRWENGESITTQGSLAPDGRFDIPVGTQRGKLYLDAPWYQRKRMDCQPEPPHSVLAFGIVQLEPAGRLRVRLPESLDANAKHGWTVRASKEGRGLSSKASMDPQTGEATLEGLPEGRVSVRLETADGGDIAGVLPADVEVVAGEIRVVVLSLHGSKPMIDLSLYFGWERFPGSTGLNSNNSSVVYADEKLYGYAPEVRLTQGGREIPIEDRYHFVWRFADVDRHVPIELTVRDEAIENRTATIQPYAETTILLRGRSAIRFEIIDAETRQSIENASIQILRGSFNAGPWTPLDASGVIDALPPERLQAYARADGYVTVGTNIEELAIGETRKAVIELHRISTVTGRLTSGGRGLASVNVSLHRTEEDGSWKRQASTRTDATGHFTLQAHKAGLHQVRTTWSTGATSEPFHVQHGESYDGFHFDLPATGHLTVDLGELPQELQKNCRLHIHHNGRWSEGSWLQYHPHTYRGLTPGTLKIAVTDGSFSPHEDERNFQLQTVVQLNPGEHKSIKIDPVLRPAHIKFSFEGHEWSRGKWSTGFFASPDAMDPEQLHDPYPIEETQREWTYSIAGGTWYVLLRSEDGKHEIRFPEPVSVKGGETKRLQVREDMLSGPGR